MIHFLICDDSITCAKNGGFRTFQHSPLPPVEVIDTIKGSLAAFVPVLVKYPTTRIVCRSNKISSKCEVRLLPESRRLLIYTNAHAGFMLDISVALSVSVRAQKSKFLRARINFGFGQVQLDFPKQFGWWTLGILAAHEPGSALPNQELLQKRGETGSNRSLNQNFEMEVMPYVESTETTKFKFEKKSVAEVSDNPSMTYEQVEVYPEEICIPQKSLSCPQLYQINKTSSYDDATLIQSGKSRWLATSISASTNEITEMVETQKFNSLNSIICADNKASSTLTLNTATETNCNLKLKPETKPLFLKMATLKPKISMRSKRLPQWPPSPPVILESNSDSENSNDLNPRKFSNARSESRMLRRSTMDRFCPIVTESTINENFKQDWELDEDAVSLKSNASTRCFFYNLNFATVEGKNTPSNVDSSVLKNTSYSTGPMKSFHCLEAIRDKINGYIFPQVPNFFDASSATTTSHKTTSFAVPQMELISPVLSTISIATAIGLEDVGESFV